MQIVTTLLDAGWELAQRLSPNSDLLFLQGGERDWLPATVPGHVHLDLVRAGVIGDPFWRMQERGCHWVDEADWSYRTTFIVDEAQMQARGENGRHFLKFGGLDTIGRIFLNGQQIGGAENFFLPYRFDVTEILRDGSNDLRIEFDSALRIGQEKAAAYLGDGTSSRGRQGYFNFGPRAFVRKPQYMFGWDWGPELISCGIHQPVELVTVPQAEITDWRMEYDFLEENLVDIRLTVTVNKYDDAPIAVGASLFAAGDTTPTTVLEGGPGTYTVPLAIHEFECVRWNVNGQEGPQKRYLLNLRLAPVEDPKSFDADWADWAVVEGVSVGFRTVELIREPDADGKGEGFRFRINGIDTFIKGANWIPDGSFPGAITETQLRERLTQARDAGMNMLRIWGGGLYESETFYKLCDELGILVWQDFAFACSMYPDDEEWFVEAVKQEAKAAIRRLRHRPSLALWCGGNENSELYQGRWEGAKQATRFYGDRLIHETLPAVLATEDPITPYWPNSPYGGEEVTSEDYGDSHYWNVWHSKVPGSDGDWVHYAESTSRFSSEFGFAAPCGMTAWESCSLPEDRTDPRSPVARHHDKTRKGYETYLGYIEKHFPQIATFEDLVYYGQANQALALQFGVEHWRRLKGRCWGTLFWQLNDCWPVQSWSVIDSAGEPKAAYYAAKRFYAPLLLSLVRNGDAIDVSLVNDRLAEIPGTLRLRLFGQEDYEFAQEFTSPANAAAGVTHAFLKLVPGLFVAYAVFENAEGKVLAENVLLLVEPKYLPSRAVDLTTEIASDGDGTATITVSANGLAAFVWLRFEGLSGRVPTFSDNWFHLLPDTSRAIKVGNLPGDLSADELQARLRVRFL